jgi:hypothetical protein
VEANPFDDLYLDDFVQANKRWMSRWISFWCLSNVSPRVSRYCLRDDQFIGQNLRGLLE